MRTNKFWRSVSWLMPVIVLFSGCLQSKSLDASRRLAAQSPMPLPVTFQMKRSLQDFGKMLRAYSGQTGTVVIQVDLMPNETGITKELPKEIGPWVVAAITTIGRPLSTIRPFDSNVTLDSAGSIQNFAAPRPAHDLIIRGQLQRGSDRVVSGREWRAGAIGRIERGDSDSQLGTEKRVTLRNYRMQLYLADKEGRTLPIPAAAYEVFQRSDEQSANFSIYYEGCGGGYNGKVLINQDAGDAFSDATAAAVIELLGRWQHLPYHLTSEVFAENPEREAGLRADLEVMSPEQLEFSTKRIGYASGLNLDVENPSIVSGEDKEILANSMRKLKLAPDNRKDQEKFVAKLWRELDWRRGSARMENWVRAIERNASQTTARNRNKSAPRTRAIPEPDLPLRTEEVHRTISLSGTRRLAVDLRKLPNQKARLDLVAKILTSEPGMEVTSDTESFEKCVINYSGNPIVIQRKFRRTEDLSQRYCFHWTNIEWSGLCVEPRLNPAN